MDSSSKALSLSAPIVPTERENSMHNTTTMKQTSSRRTPSFSSSSSLASNSSLGSSSSSSSSSSSYNPDHDHHHTSPIRFSGVPFSWEHFPGIPKKQHSKKKQESSNKQQLLPLPPPTTPTSSVTKKFNLDDIWAKNSNKNKRYHPKQTIQRDPFFAALVQCSKNDDEEGDDEEDQSNASFWNGGKVTRSLSDRFGFVNLYTSCKRTCTVSESIIYLPRSSRSSYDLINTSSRLS